MRVQGVATAPVLGVVRDHWVLYEDPTMELPGGGETLLCSGFSSVGATAQPGYLCAIRVSTLWQ